MSERSERDARRERESKEHNWTRIANAANHNCHSDEVFNERNLAAMKVENDKLRSQLKAKDEMIEELRFKLNSSKKLQKDHSELLAKQKATEFELNEWKAKFERLQQEAENLRKELQTMCNQQMTQSLYKTTDRSQEEIKKYITFAISTKEAEYNALLSQHKDLLTRIGDSIRFECHRFENNAIIIDELMRLFEEAKQSCDLYVKEKLRVMKELKQKSDQLLTTGYGDILNTFPSIELPSLPDILDFYKRLLDRMPIEALEAKVMQTSPKSIAVTTQKADEIFNASLQFSPTPSISAPSVQNYQSNPNSNVSVPPPACTITQIDNQPKKRNYGKLITKLKPKFPNLDDGQLINYIEEFHKTRSFNGLLLSRIVEEVSKFICAKYGNITQPKVIEGVSGCKPSVSGALNNIASIPSHLPIAQNSIQNAQKDALKQPPNQLNIIGNVNDLSENCTICLEKFDYKNSKYNLECGHDFHKKVRSVTV
ncbi:hypothetical protein B4U79_18444 [Dinothrombium tinctorium]|uniref:RING-type domain-containing protein n=1 Tax=Dinothrombium tinctorium TaxID=1965070 RepID=A0A3S3P1R3_9ACAR|nr:hypothetical protein B4U79_18444 [Dinothrombium tinctorium]